MLLNELSKSTDFEKLLREHFDFILPVKQLSVFKAQAMLGKAQTTIDMIRKSEKYHLGEQNAVYLSMIATERFLTEYLHEKAVLLEKDKIDPSKYAGASVQALARGVNTAHGFVPTVVGGAAAAFTSGLKGQALNTEHGRVKISDFEKELGGLASADALGTDKVLDSVIKKHFSEFKNPTDQRNIKQFLQKLVRSGFQNEIETPTTIAQKMAQIPGNPFKSVTDSTKRKEVADKLFELYSTAKKKNQGPRWVLPNNPVVSDVVSALQNQGYKPNEAKTAVQKALDKNKDLGTVLSRVGAIAPEQAENYFNDLLRLALSIE